MPAVRRKPERASTWTEAKLREGKEERELPERWFESLTLATPEAHSIPYIPKLCEPINPYTFCSNSLCPALCIKNFCLKPAPIRGLNPTAEKKEGPERRNSEATELS